MNITTGIRACGTVIVAIQAAASVAFAMNVSAPAVEMAPMSACMPATELPAGHDNLVDINSAPRDWLVWLGIDEGLAAKIIGSRPYQASRDLLIKGILPREIYEKVKSRIIARQV